MPLLLADCLTFKLANMKKERLLEYAAWINAKLTKINDTIAEATKNHNYGKATQYAGMRDAYNEVLEMVNREISTLSRSN